MPGGNLIRKRHQVLINSLSSGDVAVSSGVITIKQYGNEITVANISNIDRIDHVAATSKVSSVLVKPTYPNDDTYGYEGGISIQRNYSFIGDPHRFYGHMKPYTYKLENLKAEASGYLNVEDRAELAGYIMEMINDDIHAKIVTATVTYYLAFTASGTVAVHDLRGNEILAATTYANAANAQVGLDALDGITAVVDGSDGVYVTAASEGLVFTLQSTKWALGNTWIGLTQYDTDYPYTTHILNGFGTETITTAYVKEILPLSQVQQIFPILPYSAVGATPTLPLAATDYSKFTFTITHPDAAGIVASSRSESFEEIVEFYMPTTVMDGAYWADILYPTLVEAGLFADTIGATTATCTGASGAGAGTMSVVDVPGYVVSDVKYYADPGNSGTINVSTGVIASGTDADIFYAEIQYAHLDYLVVSKMTCATFVAGGVTFTGAMLTLAEVAHATAPYVFLGRWDLTVDGSGLGTPVVRDFGVAIEQMYWTTGSGDTVVVNPVTGEHTTGGANTDESISNIKFAGVTETQDFDHTWVTGSLISVTVTSVPV